MTDTIFLHGLKAQSLIGVYDWERTREQTLIIDLELQLDLAPAGRSDRVEDTLHYAQVADFVRQQTATQSFQLLEALAEHLAQNLLQTFPCQSVRLHITKPGILPNVAATGIGIERHAR